MPIKQTGLVVAVAGAACAGDFSRKFVQIWKSRDSVNSTILPSFERSLAAISASRRFICMWCRPVHGVLQTGTAHRHCGAAAGKP